jgi:hypothetical protein
MRKKKKILIYFFPLAGVGAGNELEQVYPADAQLVPVLTDIFMLFLFSVYYFCNNLQRN